MWYRDSCHVGVFCHLYNCSCTNGQINHNIYSVIGLKIGASFTPEEEEEVNDEDDKDYDVAEQER